MVAVVGLVVVDGAGAGVLVDSGGVADASVIDTTCVVVVVISVVVVVVAGVVDVIAPLSELLS